MKKGILFDLDGTLWDASKEVVKSWRIALEDKPDLKERMTVESLQAVMGKTMDEIGEILLGDIEEKEREKILAHCIKTENEFIRNHGGQLFDGLEETLTMLKKDYHLYIVSNCQIGYIEAFLYYYKLEDYFDDFECFGATKRPKGENIALVVERNHLDQAVYLGDTKGDYEAATYAFVPFIHARMGYGEIKEEVPYITELKELKEVIKSCIEHA